MSAGSDAFPGPLAASSKGEDYDHKARCDAGSSPGLGKTYSRALDQTYPIIIHVIYSGASPLSY